MTMGLARHAASVTGGVDVTFSKFLPRYSVLVVGGQVVAGSREAMDLALFRANKSVRPRVRGLRNPARSTRRTDFASRGVPLPVLESASREPYRRLASTPIEDQLGRPCGCAACERDGAHEPTCGVHAGEPCDCATGERARP